MLSKVAGADYVKIQKRNPDVCVPEHQKNVMRETPWGKMTYLDYKYKVEFGKEEYDEIDQYCKYKNIDWSAPTMIKIPSTVSGHSDLHKEVSKFYKKKIIVLVVLQMKSIKVMF